jgi:multisubunit Na+/H+ antiporter MnhF subunit
MGKEQIWMEHPWDLLDVNIFPSVSMTIDQRVNALTRLVIIVFLILIAIKYPYSIHFLLFSILIILILYFVSSKEPFRFMDQPRKYKNPLLQRNLSDQKMAIDPLIFPRSHDKDVWSFPSYRHSAVNYNNMRYNISEDYTPMPEHENYKEVDPRMETYTDFSLESMGQYCDNRPKPTTQTMDEISGMSAPLSADNALTGEQPQNGREGLSYSSSLRSSSTPIQQVLPPQQYQNGQTLNSSIPLTATRQLPYQAQQPDNHQYNSILSNTERFYPLYPQPRQYNYPQDEQPNFTYSKRQMQLPRQPSEFETISGTDPNSRQSEPEDGVINREEQQLHNVHAPITSLLIPKTITSIYGPDQVTPEERVKYFTNIQPNINSYSQMATPINNNIGISYNPDLPPRVLDQTVTPYAIEPLMSRIDPQLVREDGLSYERRLEMPRRTAWSAKYNTFDAAPGSQDISQIYDPRFNFSSGDQNRSYGDVDLGQVSYFYSDIDAYKADLFPFRSKVDFIDYTSPQGKVLPEYNSSVSIEDIRQNVESQYTADTLYQRTDLMERLMRKRNQEMYQLRAAPLRSTAHPSTFTSNY